jgi:hypothetical protein
MIYRLCLEPHFNGIKGIFHYLSYHTSNLHHWLVLLLFLYNIKKAILNQTSSLPTEVSSWSLLFSLVGRWSVEWTPLRDPFTCKRVELSEKNLSL